MPLRRNPTQERSESPRARFDLAAADLFAELRSLGLAFEELDDLRRLPRKDRRALVPLVNALQTSTYKPLVQHIASVLGSRWARPDSAPALIAKFRSVDPATDPGTDSIRWAVGDALRVVADDAVVDDVVQIACDKTHSFHRGGVVEALGNMKTNRQRIVPLLLDLLDEPAVAVFAINALGKLRAVEARGRLEAIYLGGDSFARRRAGQALKRLPTSPK